jgi:hypothetical protein
MSSSNVISLDSRRSWRRFEKRLAQNALVLNAAIKDPRLSREDLKLLARLLDARPFSGVMQIPYTPDNQAVVRCFMKLQHTGYLGAEQVRKRHDLPFKQTQWVFELTPREQTREWV